MKHSSRVQEIELEIQGMTWMGWETKVVRALEELPGVKKAVASFPGKKTLVTYDQASVTIDKICQTLLKAGYVAIPKTNERKILTGILDEPQEKADYEIGDLVCYCFEYTRDDIEQDFIKNGRSLIMEKIVAEKKTGGCDCANKNPKGRWCLADVRQVVDGIKEDARMGWLWRSKF